MGRIEKVGYRYQDLKLTLNTVKYMRPQQIYNKLYNIFICNTNKKYFVNRTHLKPRILDENIIFDNNIIPIYKNHYDYDFIKAERILDNDFNFLNMPSVKFDEEVKWSYNPYDYKLWTFNLNYFDFLFDLVKAYIKSEDENYLQKGLELMLSWIKGNVYFNHLTWDPYVTAKRIVNWIAFIDFLTSIDYLTGSYDRENLTNGIYDSIGMQAYYLSKNVEYSLGANHVIMEAKGLIFAGLTSGIGSYVSRGYRILQKEFEEQILPDGGHYERSVSYHIEVLMHYLETAIILIRSGKRDIGEELVQKIKPMFDYLYNIIKPNGCIPLLNDSSEEYPIPAYEILSCGVVLYDRPDMKVYCKDKISEYALFLLGSKAFRKYEIIGSSETDILRDKDFNDTGYYLMKDISNDKNEIYILFDLGNNGPDYNLGHAHADNLNVLISLNNSDIFTDPGTYTYKIGEERTYFRSTNSHNTVTIDGISSSQIWSSFRVAERAYSCVTKYSDMPAVKVISGYHDGYTKTLKKDKIFHSRTLIYYRKKWLLIIDNLHGKISNTHTATLNYMLGENVEICSENKNNIYCILPNNVGVILWFNNEYIVEKAFISHFFGSKNLTNKVTVKKKFDKDDVLLTLVQFDKTYHNISWSINNNEVHIQFQLADGYETLSYDLSNNSGQIITLVDGLLYL